MQWDDVLLVGDEELDRQHRAVFAELPPLLDACKQGNESGAVSKLMTFLEDYVTRHFDMEEQLQKQYVYPNHLEHKAEHDRFREHLSSLKELFILDGGTTRFVMLVSYFAYELITRHAYTMDKLFAQFAKREGK